MAKATFMQHAKIYKVPQDRASTDQVCTILHLFNRPALELQLLCLNKTFKLRCIQTG